LEGRHSQEERCPTTQPKVEHCRRLDAGDVNGLLDLYADEVSFEDPVGSTRRRCRDTLRTHVTSSSPPALRRPREKQVADEMTSTF
jgi:hypothetical protein